MDTDSTFGPSDPDLWLKRPLGYWEAQLMVNWPPGVPGIKTKYLFNDIMEEAENVVTPIANNIQMYR